MIITTHHFLLLWASNGVMRLHRAPFYIILESRGHAAITPHTFPYYFADSMGRGDFTTYFSMLFWWLDKARQLHRAPFYVSLKARWGVATPQRTFLYYFKGSRARGIKYMKTYLSFMPKSFFCPLFIKINTNDIRIVNFIPC